MNPNQVLPLPGYENIFGTKKAFVGEMAGPDAYAAGGAELRASTLGWGGFDAVQVVGLSYSGTYYCYVQYLPVDAAPSDRKDAVPAVSILWYVRATGAQVADEVDLSGEIIRLFALGV